MADHPPKVSVGSLKHEFCDHCPGCRPAIVNATTGKVLRSDSEQMKRIMLMWKRDTTYAERKAFIDVTVNQLHDPQTMKLAQSVVEKIARALNSK